MFKELGWEGEEEKVFYPQQQRRPSWLSPLWSWEVSVCPGRLWGRACLARRADSAQMHPAWWEKPPANSQLCKNPSSFGTQLETSHLGVAVSRKGPRRVGSKFASVSSSPTPPPLQAGLEEQR